MKTKLVLTFGALCAAVLLLAGYYLFLAPKPSEGEKSVTIEIVIEREGIDKTFHYDTDDAFVSELLLEKDELQAQGTDGQYGYFITSLLGVEADADSEYYNIKENGVDATVGVSQLSLIDGSTYTFSLVQF